jgi:hypothetical protein
MTVFGDNTYHDDKFNDDILQGIVRKIDSCPSLIVYGSCGKFLPGLWAFQ